MAETGFSIAVVERETGLSKDVLRVWERRYGFPFPERDAHGERMYPAGQVDRLRLIKRLMDKGYRPGKLIPLELEALQNLAPRFPLPAADAVRLSNDELHGLLAMIRQHDGAGYSQAMQQRLARQGLSVFVQDIVAPLTRMVGEAWENGEFEVFEEHLFTELTKRLLRQAIAGLSPNANGPRILLTSLPGEPHVLGLLMVEALCMLESAQCIPLGTEMPLREIARAVEAHRADVVALSFAQGFPSRQLPGLLQQLRQSVPGTVAIWAGGSGIQRQPALPGVQLMHSLNDPVMAIREWQGQPAVDRS